MKTRILYGIILLTALAAGCNKDVNLLYSDIARVQLNDTTTSNYTFVYEPAALLQDTVYVQVNTIGGITGEDRPVTLVQVPEYDVSYVRDPVTNAITDTIFTEKPNKAIPGTHYIAMDNPAAKSLSVVKAGEVTARVPVILLRDPSLKNGSYRLRLQLAANDQFGLGELQRQAVTIVFSDRLERFYSWRIDNTSASAFNSFGKYSTGKHQFMIDVLNTQIDEEWYQAILAIQATQNYKNLLKQALTDFNADPANIASGKAPVREDPNDPNSLLIAFP